MPQQQQHKQRRWEKALDAFHAAGAQCLAEVGGPNKSELRFFSVPPRGELRILQTFHADGEDRFEVFRPASDSNSIEATLRAALPRFAYTAVTSKGALPQQFIIGRADEGTTGYAPLPEHGGFDSYGDAALKAEAMNKSLGLDPIDAITIVAGTQRKPEPEPEKLAGRELATVLAALRYWQESSSPRRKMPVDFDGGEHFADETPLDEGEIDALCERLNCA